MSYTCEMQQLTDFLKNALLEAKLPRIYYAIVRRASVPFRPGGVQGVTAGGYRVWVAPRPDHIGSLPNRSLEYFSLRTVETTAASGRGLGAWQLLISESKSAASCAPLHCGWSSASTRKFDEAAEAAASTGLHCRPAHGIAHHCEQLSLIDANSRRSFYSNTVVVPGIRAPTLAENQVTVVRDFS